MNQKSEIQRGAGPATALIELLDEIPESDSISEIAESAARLTVDTLGAAAAVVVDGFGPVGLHPPGLPPEFVAEFCDRWHGPSREPAAGNESGLLLTSTELPSTSSIGVVAGWAPTSGPHTEDLALVAAVADARIRQTGKGSNEEERGQAMSVRPEQSQGLIESVPAAVYIAEIGDKGRWLYVSPQIVTILGYSPQEWTADRDLWFNSIHPDDRMFPQIFEDERLIGLDVHWPAEYRIRNKEGRYVWVYDEATLIQEGDGPPVWYGFLQDITRRKAAEVAAGNRAGQQVMIARIGEMALKGASPDELIEFTAESIAELEGIVEATILEQESFQKVVLSYRSGGREGMSEFPYETDRFPGDRLSAGKVVSIPDWRADPRLEPYVDYLPPDIRCTSMVTIGGSENQFGLLTVHSDEPARFSEQDTNFLRAVAGVLGNAIERSRADDQLHYRLEHDRLTGLPNRELFTRRLESAMKRARATGGLTGLLFLDVDHFKVINDGIGHHAGDTLLKKLAAVLSEGVREGDTVARFGGDEFSVVLARVKDREDAREAAARLLEKIARPVTIEGVERYVTASLGIALYSPGTGGNKTAADLIQEADAAMYRAKELGREQVQIYGRPIRDRAVRRLEVERELHSAIDNRELAVYYQPVVSLRTGRIIAFEALVRWKHREKGLLRPAEFIPIAEETDLITKVDSVVLREAARQVGIWSRDLPEENMISVSVNTSARQIANSLLPSIVSELLAEHSLHSDQLVLEITETALVDSATNNEISRVLDQLDRIGTRIVLDDFGTGFSSLAYLSEFPLFGLKIDRAFVRRLSRGDPKGSALANAIVHIGRALSLVVVAEAITEATDLDKINEIGCHAAQGRYFSGPVTAEEASALLFNQPRWIKNREE